MKHYPQLSSQWALLGISDLLLDKGGILQFSENKTDLDIFICPFFLCIFHSVVIWGPFVSLVIVITTELTWNMYAQKKKIKAVNWKDWNKSLTSGTNLKFYFKSKYHGLNILRWFMNYFYFKCYDSLIRKLIENITWIGI